MSGGSFGNISSSDLELPTLEHDRIVEALAAYDVPGAKQAASVLRECLEQLRAAQARAAEKWNDYRNVLRAVEWQHSGDCGVEQVIEALASRTAQLQSRTSTSAPGDISWADVPYGAIVLDHQGDVAMRLDDAGKWLWVGPQTCGLPDLDDDEHQHMWSDWANAGSAFPWLPEGLVIPDRRARLLATGVTRETTCDELHKLAAAGVERLRAGSKSAT